jgi:undecaprenyl-diphosphatase
MINPISDCADRLRMSRTGLIWTAMIIALLPLVFLEDGPIRTLLKDHRIHFLFKLMHILTWLGVGWVLAVLAAVLLGIGYLRGNLKLRKAAVLSLIALLVSGLAVQTIKHLIGRPRPRLADQGIVGWGSSFQSGHDSFPSGHALSSFAMAAVLSSFYPGGQWIWYSLAVLVAITRIYIDAHFASDVFVGAVLGVLIGIWASRLKLGYLKS